MQQELTPVADIIDIRREIAALTADNDAGPLAAALERIIGLARDAETDPTSRGVRPAEILRAVGEELAI